jgi:hypothetical protein
MRCACGRPSVYSVTTTPDAKAPIINPCQEHVAQILDNVSRVEPVLFITRVD